MEEDREAYGVQPVSLIQAAYF